MAEYEDRAQLCESCRRIPWGPAGWEKFHSPMHDHVLNRLTSAEPNRIIDYQVSRKEFKQQSEYCLWCKLLLLGLQSVKFDDRCLQHLTSSEWEKIRYLDVSLEFPTIQHAWPKNLNKIEVSCSIRYGEDTIIPTYLKLGVFAYPGSLASKTFLAPSWQVASPPGYNDALARKWLYQCQQSHGKCTQPSSSKLPSRIIDLSNVGTSCSITLRQSTDGETGDYACLSYTWGRTWSKEAFDRLARSGYETPLDTKDLPATFQDAVRVTESLNLSYLWIDALCTWQTDPDDLAHELSRMDQYYQDAEIVIQCSGTQSVDDRFLGESRLCSLSKVFLRKDDEIPLEVLKLSESDDDPVRSGEDVAELGQDAGLNRTTSGSVQLPTRSGDPPELVDAAVSEDVLESEGAFQPEGLRESEGQALVSEGESPGSGDAARSDDAAGPEEAPGSEASVSQVVSRAEVAPKSPDASQSEGSATIESDADPDRPPLDPDNEEVVLLFPYISSAGTGDEIFVQLANDVKRYKESEEHAASRGWILQEQMLCRRLLTFPSTGGMIFRCDESQDVLLGGNVIYDTDSQKSKRWGKERLLTEDQAAAMDIQRFSGRLKAKIDTIRHLAMSGSSPALWLMPYARIIELDHDPTLRGPPSEGTCKIMQARVRMPRNRRQLVPLSDQNAPALPVGTPVDQQGQTEMPITTTCDPDTAVLRQTMVFEWHDRYRLINIEPPQGAIMAEDVDRAWKSMVTDYGHRQLSYPADKLIAIAALAKEYASRYGTCLGDYKAGIWAEFLPLSLTWKVLNKSRTHSPPGSKRAPSWSWAAVEGASYHDFHFSEEDGEPDYLDPEIEVLECETVLHKESLPFGAVTDGFLKLHGKVLDVKWGPRNDETRDSRFTVYHSECGDTLCRKECAAYPDHLDCQPRDVPEPATLLLVQRSVQGVGHEDDHYVDALLLKALGDGEDYVRVGYMYCCMEDYKKAWSGRFRDEVITIR